MATKPDINIVIVEGPAGSGKSTWIKALELLPSNVNKDIMYIPVPKGTTKNRRDYDSFDNGASESLIKDATQLLWIFESVLRIPRYQQKKVVFLVDRMFLSQYVYGSIRLSDRPNLESVIQTLKLGLQTASAVLDDWQHRDNPHGKDSFSVNVLPLIYVPSVSVIESRRQQSGKEYPYLAEEEVEIYQFIAENILVSAPDCFTEFPHPEYLDIADISGFIGKTFFERGTHDRD